MTPPRLVEIEVKVRFKEYEIEGRYNWRGRPNMIKHVLQSSDGICKKYLSEVRYRVYNL